MTKIFESPLNGFDERGESIIVYSYDDEREYYKIDEMDMDELLEMLGYFDESVYNIQPGARYRTYNIKKCSQHLIVQEYVCYNV